MTRSSPLFHLRPPSWKQEWGYRMSRTKDDSAKSDARPLAVDTITAAKMLDMSPGTLENWRYSKKPKGPRWARIEGKVVYPVAELERYLAEHMV